MPQRKSISIVIPNYNGVSLLEKYLPDTLRAIEYANVPYELIVVDDCSTDNSVHFIQANYPEVNLLVNASNQGFSFSCNQGINRAKMDLVLLLNSDVSLSEDYFSTLWKYFEDPLTFGVMSRIMNTNGKIEDAARFLSFSGLKFKSTNFYYSEDPAIRTPTAYLSGANALICREKLMELNGFDEVFSPFYSEDVDLSFRAWKQGWKCFYDHQAVCYHEVSTTTRQVRTKKGLNVAVYKNKFILHAIHLNGIPLVLWLGQMVFIEVLFRVLIGRFWILNALKGFIKSSSGIRYSREKLRQQMNLRKSQLSLFDVKRIYFDPVQKLDIRLLDK